MQTQEALAAIGQLPDADIDLAEAALWLGLRDAADADFAAARAHLTEIARSVVAAARASDCDAPVDRASILADILTRRFGYRGDSETYDDLANANLLRVIARRRGMPVALGILWLHAAEAAGWSASGLDMPGHFLVGLETNGQQTVLDVFAGGIVLDPVRLEELARHVTRRTDRLERLLRPMTKRGVLLRLVANTITRREESGDTAGALNAIADALLVAPDMASLWREAGLLQERLDQMAAALGSYRRYLELAAPGPETDRVRDMVERLRTRLN